MVNISNIPIFQIVKLLKLFGTEIPGFFKKSLFFNIYLYSLFYAEHAFTYINLQQQFVFKIQGFCSEKNNSQINNMRLYKKL